MINDLVWVGSFRDARTTSLPARWRPYLIDFVSVHVHPFRGGMFVAVGIPVAFVDECLGSVRHDDRFRN